MTTDAPTRLRTAAAKLRASAEAATPGPWVVLPGRDEDSVDAGVMRDGGNRIVVEHEQARSADAAHIALTADPALSLLLADWLDATADRYEAIADNFAPGSKAGAVTAFENVDGMTHALALADHINT